MSEKSRRDTRDDLEEMKRLRAGMVETRNQRIRELAGKGETVMVIARRMGVSSSTVSAVLLRAGIHAQRANTWLADGPPV